MACSKCNNKVSNNKNDIEKLLETSKLEGFLGIEEGRFDYDFQYVYKNRQFHFYLLIRDSTTGETISILLGKE